MRRCLVCTYDHAERQLSKRLTTAYHEHHELSLASLHVHLDHDTCLEVTVLRGKTDDVQHFGEHVIAERSVRHGKIVRIPFDPPAKASVPLHSHHDGAHHHRHGNAKTPPRRPKSTRIARR